MPDDLTGTEIVHAAASLLPGDSPLGFALAACALAPARPRLTQHLRRVTCDACLQLLVALAPGAGHA
tara:strand:+ start:444 stop:644 length:201 start_codon:yes stop_codon:yes gene_type:complete